MQIETAVMTDLSALVDLYAELEPQRPCDPAAVELTLAKVLADPRYRLLVARPSAEARPWGTAMGILCYDLVGDCAPFMVVENFVVAAQARGQGVGKLLLQALEAEALAEHCTCLMLQSNSSRLPAHAFYHAQSYDSTHTIGFKKQLPRA